MNQHPHWYHHGYGFCNVAKVAIHPENNLTTFGYILGMKVEKTQNPFIFAYLLELIIKKIGDFEIFHSKSDEFGTFFP